MNNCLDCESVHAGLGSMFLTALRVDCGESERTVFDDACDDELQITPPDWCPRKTNDAPLS